MKFSSIFMVTYVAHFQKALIHDRHIMLWSRGKSIIIIITIQSSAPSALTYHVVFSQVVVWIATGFTMPSPNAQI
jgi:hypothetical protein